MAPVQAACISFVLTFLGDPVDVQSPTGERLSEQTRLLARGDLKGRKGLFQFGKKAVPWLNRALLQTEGGSRGHLAGREYGFDESGKSLAAHRPSLTRARWGSKSVASAQEAGYRSGIVSPPSAACGYGQWAKR